MKWLFTLLMLAGLMLGGCAPSQRKVCAFCNLISLPFDLFAKQASSSDAATQPFGVDPNTGELR